MKGLDGLRILVTRPAGQAQPLCELIEAEGGHCLRQPLVSIEAPSDTPAAIAALEQVADADILIFTSRNAVAGAQSLLPSWRPAGRLAAIGEATRRAVEANTDWCRGIEVLAPERDFRSESLLAMPAMQAVQDRRIAIMTGEGGRGTLADVLTQRGARVQQVPVYRRQPCSVDEPRMRALLGEADATIVTSGEALEHLIRLVPSGMDAVLRHLQLVVPSNRVLKMALEFGFEHRPLLPEKMNNESMVAVLRRWAQHGKR